MFTQSCFIRKNTPELRKKLEKLGYKYSGRDTESWGTSALYCFYGEYYEVYPAQPSRYHSIVNCGTNEELFLALAALRDDTDINQWVIDEANECFFGLENSWSICDKDDMNERVVYTHYRKATVEEIIEHFKE